MSKSQELFHSPGIKEAQMSPRWQEITIRQGESTLR